MGDTHSASVNYEDASVISRIFAKDILALVLWALQAVAR